MAGLQQRTALGLSRTINRGSIGDVVGRGWAFAAGGYLIAIVLYLLCQFLINALFNLGGLSASEALDFLFGIHLLIACPALLGCVNLAVRGYDHASEGDRGIFAWTICGSALLAPLVILFVVLGLIGVVAVGGPAGDVLYASGVQLAGLVIAVITAMWSLAWVGEHTTPGS